MVSEFTEPRSCGPQYPAALGDDECDIFVVFSQGPSTRRGIDERAQAIIVPALRRRSDDQDFDQDHMATRGGRRRSRP